MKGQVEIFFFFFHMSCRSTSTTPSLTGAFHPLKLSSPETAWTPARVPPTLPCPPALQNHTAGVVLAPQ